MTRPNGNNFEKVVANSYLNGDLLKPNGSAVILRPKVLNQRYFTHNNVLS